MDNKRSKRRKDKYNPYTLHTEKGKYYISFTDANNCIQKVLISKKIFATVYKGNIIKNLIMDCQSYTKYRPNETTGGVFVSWQRKEELPTGA